MAKNTAYDIIFILFISIICHLLFSKFGFNPTDEGFVLSASNRLMHGQIPHVDFSSVRPLGYAYLHIPELLFSKTHVFLMSRFIFWLEQVLIAYFWISIIIRYSNTEVTLFLKYTLIIICFLFNVHYFPASVLHTIDGLLLSVLGIYFIISEKKWNYIGYFFIGYILLNNGWHDLSIQLSGHNEIVNVGIYSYLSNPLMYIGFISVFVYYKMKINKIYLSILIFSVASILLISNHYHGKFIFLFLGLIAGETTHKIVKQENCILPFIALIIAWSVSISVGYNSPALFAGGMISILIFVHFNSLKNRIQNKILLLFLLVGISIFYFVRTNNIYRDMPKKYLHYKLDNLVEGAHGIYTNKNTYSVLLELDSLKKTTQNLVTVPDFTACNVLHSHQSKILTEWPNKTEIPNEKILGKVTSKIKNDTALLFAIPIFQTALLKDGFSPQENKGLSYPIIKFIKENYRKTSFTDYFEIRKK
ncbi:MAG TPA: hypothetical protein PK628_07110 [Chitinophagales bacterium]|nr:hypothetical protein [Chitinophagales bacterium]